MIAAFAPINTNLYLCPTLSSTDFFFKLFETTSLPDAEPVIPIITVTMSMTMVTAAEFAFQTHPTTINIATVTGILATGTAFSALPTLTQTTPVITKTNTNCPAVPTPSISASEGSSKDYSDIEIINYIMLSLVAFTFIANSMNLLMGAITYQNFWSLINEYQLYQTLVLYGAFVPERLIRFWADLSFSIFSFSFFIDFGAPNPIEWLGKDFNLEQQKKMYRRVGVKSSSLFMNETYFVLFLFSIILIDVIVTP
jgi:hypothetical protein